MESDKISCTYEGCYQVFDTVESMKKHKHRADDNIHAFYCKQCDEDCEDDVDELIHKIQSRKHIVCPVCGKDFQSEGGRDRHVGINHKTKQRLECPAKCKTIFDSAAALMGHIENNKCKVITRDDFLKRRAEQQIERDALEELQGSVGQHLTQITSVGSDPDSNNGGISLLDNERAHLERDWQGNPISDPRTSARGNSLSQGLSELSINRYPPLMATRAQANTQSKVPTWPAQNNGDLLDVQETPEVRPSKPKTLIGDNNVWGTNNRLVQSRPQPQRVPSSSSNLLDTASSLNLLGSTMTVESAATRGTTRQSTTANSKTNTVPPAARPENPDPNASYAQIQTQSSKPRFPSHLELHRFWDSIQGVYICPGNNCGARISNPSAFEAHLVSAAHVAQKVQCPSCLKKFKTTTALVAHAESGSVRCDLRNSTEYDLMLRQMTAGLISADGNWRDGSVKYESNPIW